MKRAITLLLALVFLAPLGTQVVYALPDGLPYEPPVVTISSPSQDRTYNVADMPLSVTVQIFRFIYHNMETLKSLNYSLDGQAAVPMTLIAPSDLSPGYQVHGNGVLTGLVDGVHSVTVYGETAISGLSENFNATVSFRVDTSTPPHPEVFPNNVGRSCFGITIYSWCRFDSLLHKAQKQRKKPKATAK
jgi:hypothetical protein